MQNESPTFVIVFFVFFKTHFILFLFFFGVSLVAITQKPNTKKCSGIMFLFQEPFRPLTTLLSAAFLFFIYFFAKCQTSRLNLCVCCIDAESNCSNVSLLLFPVQAPVPAALQPPGVHCTRDDVGEPPHQKPLSVSKLKCHSNVFFYRSFFLLQLSSKHSRHRS